MIQATIYDLPIILKMTKYPSLTGLHGPVNTVNFIDYLTIIYSRACNEVRVDQMINIITTRETEYFYKFIVIVHYRSFQKFQGSMVSADMDNKINPEEKINGEEIRER